MTSRLSCSLCVMLGLAAVSRSMAQAPVSVLEGVSAIAASPYPDTHAFDKTVPADNGWRFHSRADMLVIVPRFESNPAFLQTTILTQGPGAPTRAIRQQQEFEYDYALSPRIQLCVTNGQGFGARARWWRYDQAAPQKTTANDPIPLGSPVLARTVEGVSPLLSSGPQTGLPAVFSLQQQGQPAQGDLFVATSGMRMDAFDLEGTIDEIRVGCWSVLLAAGTRYAQIDHTYNSDLVGNVPQFLTSHQTYEGYGPTLTVDARRPMFLPGLAVYGSGKIGMLFGKYQHTIGGRNLGLTPPFNLQDMESSISRYRFLPVIELETGVEYARVIGSLEWVLQGGVVTQLWPAGTGAHGYGNMGFLAYNISAGVRY